jgi:hypothetical protein
MTTNTMKPRTKTDILHDLATPVPPGSLEKLPGGGANAVAYLEIDYVYHRLDEVFGAANWSTSEITVNQIMPPFASTKRRKIPSGSYNPQTNAKVDKDTYITIQGLSFVINCTVKLVVMFPDGTHVMRVNTGSIAGFLETDASGHANEMKRVNGFAFSAALKCSAESLGVTFGRGMDEKGIVHKDYLLDDDAIERNADDGRHQDIETRNIAQSVAPLAIAGPASAATKLAQTVAVDENDTGKAIDLDLPIGNAAPVQAQTKTSTGIDSTVLVQLKSLMIAPEKLDTIVKWQSACRDVNNLIKTITSYDDAIGAENAISNWKAEAHNYGLFGHADIKDTLANYFGRLEQMAASTVELMKNKQAA